MMGPLILSFDGVLQLVIKRFIQLLIRKVFHNLYFGNKPSCGSSSPTATDKTPLITFAFDSVSLFGPVPISGSQLFSSCNHLGPDHQSVGIFCGPHSADATSAELSSVGTLRYWM